MRLVFDIEANGLYEDATKIWCIVTKDVDTGEVHEWTRAERPSRENSINKSLSFFDTAEELIGHNIINYDLPLLEKLTGWRPNENTKITDTLVMSRLGNPDRRKPPGYTGKGGPHSLESWGYRVGTAKPDHEEWDVFSPAMLRRCRQDVEINLIAYNILRQELSPVEKWELALEIESAMAKIMTDQENYGILFDVAKANEYIQWLTDQMDKIDAEIIPLLPKTLERLGSVPINEPFLKTGGYRKQTQEYLNEAYPSHTHSGLIGGPFNRIRFDNFNIGSIERVKDLLLNNGWIPETWNYSKTTGERTSPKLEGDFEGIEGEVPRRVKERITWRHRRSQIEGWLSKVREDNRLPAGANPCGTNTGRMKHRTVVNIPKANSSKDTGELIWDTTKQKDIFGTQMRSLFIAPEGYKIVGHDASGLELRMLAHYMNDKEFIDQILTGDIHEYNQRAAGLPNRDAAKTFIYALIYGAGDKKLGSIIGGDSADGEAIRRKYFDSLPKLERLVNSVKRASSKGYLNGLDGRAVVMRTDDIGRIRRSSALNTLLQNAGAMVMKKSCILLWEDVKAAGLDAHKVLDMHDEGQSEVLIEHVDAYCPLAVESIVKAGEFFKLNIPLAADVKVGNNMAETH